MTTYAFDKLRILSSCTLSIDRLGILSSASVSMDRLGIQQTGSIAPAAGADLAFITFLYGDNVDSDQGGAWTVKDSISSEFGADNLKHPHLGGRSWRSTSLASTWCKKYIADPSWDFLAIVGTNLADESGAVHFYAHSLDCGTTRALWNTLADIHVVVTPYQDDHKFRYVWSALQTYKYIAIFFEYPTHSAGYIEIPRIMLGQKTTLSRNFDLSWKDGRFSVSTMLKTNQNMPIGRTRNILRSLDLPFSHLEDADQQTIFDIYDQQDMLTPFIVDLNYLSATPDDMEYVVFDGDAVDCQKQTDVDEIASTQMRLKEVA